MERKEIVFLVLFLAVAVATPFLLRPLFEDASLETLLRDALALVIFCAVLMVGLALTLWRIWKREDIRKHERKYHSEEGSIPR